mgnify:CR=1 FL=1
MHSFEAQEPGELSLTLGDIVAVRQVSDPYIHTFVHSYVTLVVALCSLTLGLNGLCSLKFASYLGSNC